MATSIAPTSGSSVYVPPTASASAQVHLLNKQGQNPSEIASILGLSLPTVYQYLGLSAPGSGSVPVAAPQATPL
jgi:DNA-binding CsgD family transcriptional regulator